MLRKREKKSEDLFVGLFFAALGLYLFRKMIFSGETLFYRDFYRYFYPARLQALRLLGEQGIYAWNPYLDGGLPLLADLSHHFLLYPANILFYLVSPVTAFNLLTLFHFFWAAFGFYFLAQHYFHHKKVAICVSLSFVLSGLYLSSLDRPAYFYTVSYLPWIVLGWERLHAHKERSYLALILLSSLQFLAGEVQVVMLSQGLGMISMFMRNPQPLRRIGKMVLYVGFISLCLVAVQLLPTLELAKLSTRGGGIPFDRITVNSLHPNQLITLLFPFPFPIFPSEPGFRAIQEVFHSQGISLFASIHTGILVFVLSLWGLATTRRKEKWLWGGGMIFFLFLAMGKYLPHFYQTVTTLIPFGKSFLFPIKYYLPCQFFFSLLLGAALTDEFKTLKQKPAWISYFVCLFLLLYLATLFSSQALSVWKSRLPEVAFAQALGFATQQGYVSLIFLGGLLLAIFWSRKNAWGKNAIYVLICLELLLYAPKLVWTTSKDFFSKEPLFSHFLVESRNGLLPRYRIASFDLEEKNPLSMGFGVNALAAKRSLLRRAYIPNSGTDHDLSYADKYGPLRLQSTYHLWTGSGLSSDEIFRLYGTRYFIHSSQVVSSHHLPVAKEEEILLEEDPTVRPMVWITYQWQRKESHTLDDPPMVSGIENLADTQVSLSKPWWKSVDQITPLAKGYQVRVNAEEEGVLIISENSYPGWRAWIDGHETTIGQTYGVFKAVLIPKGEHQVQFLFQPFSVRIGLWISAITLFGIVIVTFYGKQLRSHFRDNV